MTETGYMEWLDRRKRLIKSHTRRDIKWWKRRKEIYERFQRGDSKEEIGLDYGVSAAYAVTVGNDWDSMMQCAKEGSFRCSVVYETLCAEGVIESRISVEYGYA